MSLILDNNDIKTWMQSIIDIINKNYPELKALSKGLHISGTVTVDLKVTKEQQ